MASKILASARAIEACGVPTGHHAVRIELKRRPRSVTLGNMHAAVHCPRCDAVTLRLSIRHGADGFYVLASEDGDSPTVRGLVYSNAVAWLLMRQIAERSAMVCASCCKAFRSPAGTFSGASE